MSSKIKIAEIFYSLQGEGKWAGVPSVFLRTFGCNFQCRGFGMLPGGASLNTEPEQIAERVAEFKTYEELPLASKGCDSYASWHPSFKHLSPVLSTEAIVERMEDIIPNNTWTQDNFEDVHLVITGGEPLLGWQRAYPELIDQCMTNGLQNITYETNGTQPLSDNFKIWLKDIWYEQRGYHSMTFSVSAKLPVSGEKWSEAILPEVVVEYEKYGYTYLKFVVASEKDVRDVDRAVELYREYGFKGPVYLMPVGGLPEDYHLNTAQVAELAMKKGYRYSPRLQVDIWRNAWGT
jgi:7-carboxy-7-deazaguanine synthase